MHATRSHSNGGLPHEAQNCIGTVGIVVYESSEENDFRADLVSFPRFLCFLRNNRGLQE